ncbi:MAG TPA: molecular chaperone HtpG [Candidatus Hydrogenedentes bacterium]|nr:molecular chaperone HtpG [Candidatus Hydrogenedentota bacterium]HOS02083.1 molecular chaperone HtpG [Candidatus Hydrogenedentota bacterium]
MSQDKEIRVFQAEAQQVLDLMVHSIYSNKDIFLRELISNASDALDRRRFEAVSKPEWLDAGTELHIFIDVNPDARTLTVRDNGIGMSREEVINLIGTIAKSGTQEYLKRLRQAKDAVLPPELIGQFGVGFYSAFMVADNVTLVTRRAGETAATRWESSGEGTYAVETVDKDEVGTDITLHLKSTDLEDGLHDYADPQTIRRIVKTYSDFVAYPIRMHAEKKEGQEPELDTLNSMKAIWLRPKDDVSQDEYKEFYKHIAHDWNEPLEIIRSRIEGTLEYQMLLFIPSEAPFDLFFRDGHRGIHLYVKRVFIMDDCKALLPEYLRFVRGVVDSEDLSLNISREILQQDRQIQRMRKGITGKILDTLTHLRANDPEKYRKFWAQFGRVIKEGLYQDREHRETLLDLLLCASTFADASLTSLEDYVARMKSDQDAIYYITGESQSALENSPHIEAFRDKGYEVLLLSDPVDEIWVQSASVYKGKSLKSVGRGAVELGSEDERKAAEETRKETEQSYGALLDALKEALKDHVKDVRLSGRLTTSAACLVTGEGDLSPQLEQILRAANQSVPGTKRILELNPGHPVLPKLRALHEQETAADRLADYAELLYGQALLAEGAIPPNPSRFAKLVADMMVNV